MSRTWGLLLPTSVGIPNNVSDIIEALGQVLDVVAELFEMPIYKRSVLVFPVRVKLHHG